MPFTESHYENAVLQFFQEKLGYSYIYGPDIDRDYHSPLYEDVLLPSLQRINRGLPIDAINEAVYKLKNFESGTLLQKNMVFTDYLQNGVRFGRKSCVKEDKGQSRKREQVKGLSELDTAPLNQAYPLMFRDGRRYARAA